MSKKYVKTKEQNNETLDWGAASLMSGVALIGRGNEKAEDIPDMEQPIFGYEVQDSQTEELELGEEKELSSKRFDLSVQAL